MRVILLFSENADCATNMQTLVDLLLSKNGRLHILAEVGYRESYSCTSTEQNSLTMTHVKRSSIRLSMEVEVRSVS